jgi:hypothetical protein
MALQLAGVGWTRWLVEVQCLGGSLRASNRVGHQGIAPLQNLELQFKLGTFRLMHLSLAAHQLTLTMDMNLQPLLRTYIWRQHRLHNPKLKKSHKNLRESEKSVKLSTNAI